jgi:hypothetical protein
MALEMSRINMKININSFGLSALTQFQNNLLKHTNKIGPSGVCALTLGVAGKMLRPPLTPFSSLFSYGYFSQTAQKHAP